MPIDVTFPGMCNTPDKLVQPKKALSPIEFTPEPIEREVKPMQAEKAEEPIEVTVFGMVREPLRPEQAEKADVPIEVTPLGIVSEPVKPEQP